MDTTWVSSPASRASSRASLSESIDRPWVSSAQSEPEQRLDPPRDQPVLCRTLRRPPEAGAGEFQRGEGGATCRDDQGGAEYFGTTGGLGRGDGIGGAFGGPSDVALSERRLGVEDEGSRIARPAGTVDQPAGLPPAAGDNRCPGQFQTQVGVLVAAQGIQDRDAFGQRLSRAAEQRQQPGPVDRQLGRRCP